MRRVNRLRKIVLLKFNGASLRRNRYAHHVSVLAKSGKRQIFSIERYERRIKRGAIRKLYGRAARTRHLENVREVARCLSSVKDPIARRPATRFKFSGSICDLCRNSGLQI